jgi:hypothetical protein
MMQIGTAACRWSKYLSVSASLRARLVQMRTWLYKRRCSPVRFETQPERGGVVWVSVRFDTPAMAEEFRRRFVPGAGDPSTPTDAQV